MSPSKGATADAWDDDWESIADKQDKVEPSIVEVKLSKAQRRAKHVEFNRQIWESAENPEPKLFLDARDKVPVQSTFKPTVTVLARKPVVLSKHGAIPGMTGLNLEDDEDSEEERRKRNEAEFEERKSRAHKERLEKERRYAEAREKIFGSTVPSDESRGSSPSKSSRGKGKGRGGHASKEPSPARPPNSNRQLYEPGYSPKPGSVFLRKKEGPVVRPDTLNDQERPIREPRGPQAGRGFAPRGNHNISFIS